MKRTRVLWVLPLWAAFGIASAQAETQYVTDRVTLGIHANADGASPVVASVPSGSALEVQGREGEFVKVKTADGTEGWIGAGYLTKDQPARLLLDQLGAEQRKTLQELATVKRQLAAKEKELAALRKQAQEAEAKAAAATGQAQTDAAAKAEAETSAQAEALAEARAEVESLRLRLAELERAATPAAAVADPDFAAVRAELDRVRAENTDLRARVASAHAVLDGKGVPGAEELARARPGMPVWFWGVLGVTLIAGTLGGATWMDHRARRRHGGFRI